MAKRIVFAAKDHVGTEDYQPGPVEEQSVRMRTLVSLMSTGTEGIALHGIFAEGTHWAEAVRYPFHPGYSAVGIVGEVGPGVTEFRAGDLVAARVPHASEHVVPASRCTLVPVDIPPELACWFGLAKIALMGARAARYELGDEVAVIGAGPIGQMSVRWAVAAGAHVVALDTLDARLEFAAKGGASVTVQGPVGEVHNQVIDALLGQRPRIVVDSTGNAKAFTGALGLAADRGRVVLLGDTGFPGSQCLTPDVIIRGVDVVGAHDGHSVPPHGWDGDRKIHEIFFRLVQQDRFNLAGLNTHTFAPSDCELAYKTALLNQCGTMGILFDWEAL